MDDYNKFRKLFQENCIPTAEGTKFLEDFDRALKTIFNSDEVKSMNNSQRRIIGSLLANMVGSATTDSVVKHDQMVAELEAVSDEDFESFLKEKYGESWLFVTLTPEEFERAKRVRHKEIAKIMEGVRERLAKAPPPYMPRIIPRRPFRR